MTQHDTTAKKICVMPDALSERAVAVQERGIFCFLYLKHCDHVQVRGVGNAPNTLSTGTRRYKVDVVNGMPLFLSICIM